MSLENNETDQLVSRARAGDVASIAVLMQKHRRRLKQMICARMDPRIRPRVDPSDVIQDTLTSASQQLPKYLETTAIPFYAWLRRIAWQKLVHAHERHLDAEKRSIKREQVEYQQVSDKSTLLFAKLIPGNLSTPSGAVSRKENQIRVRRALASMAEIDREVLLQRYVEQLSLKEISSVLEMTEAAVTMRHMRALQKMQKLLSADEK